jgi:hypothetical protein
MKPQMYGALDSRIRKALQREGKLPKIFDGNPTSMVSGYLQFVTILKDIQHELVLKGIRKPPCRLSEGPTWRASDIEMALFCWADDNE